MLLSFEQMLSRCVASSSDRLLNPQTPLAPGKWVFLSFLAGISISSSTTTPLMSSDKTLQGCKLLFFLVRRNFQLKQNFGQTRQNYIVGHYLKWIFSSGWLSDSHLQEGAWYKVMLSSITQDSCKSVLISWGVTMFHCHLSFFSLKCSSLLLQNTT